MRNYPMIWLSFVLLFIAGCGGVEMQTPEKTQLQMRQIQTRSYEIEDLKMIMKAMLNVLQDDGFIVKQVNMDLGFLNATKESDIENKQESSLQKFWYGQEYATYKKASTVDCTASVSQFGKEMRVRVNFQIKTINNKGGIVSVQQIDDPKYYQDFFSKVDKGIFIEKEKI